ncbi:hypothetical protein COLO4_35982 [Corchorus olitorius]|uniref:Uncharacterized protein n=1 Tax=Corchorus olitorius TaxID=93759 RepID=A0A1R3GBJ7_9ROSI|nr:hypothetical protein COLO4_35982 [Corchorus olitorius]
MGEHLTGWDPHQQPMGMLQTSKGEQFGLVRCQKESDSLMLDLVDNDVVSEIQNQSSPSLPTTSTSTSTSNSSNQEPAATVLAVNVRPRLFTQNPKLKRTCASFLADKNKPLNLSSKDYFGLLKSIHSKSKAEEDCASFLADKNKPLDLSSKDYFGLAVSVLNLFLDGYELVSPDHDRAVVLSCDIVYKFLGDFCESCYTQRTRYPRKWITPYLHLNHAGNVFYKAG